MAKALCLIEVRGKLGAILAADAAAKEANVTLLGSEVIRGGLTTIHIIGDVAAVEAAVEAGEVAVANKNCLISSHVIPRLDNQVEQMLMKSFGKKEDNPSDSKESNQPIIEEIEKDEIVEEKKDTLLVPLNESKEILQENLEHGADTIVDSFFNKRELEKMKVADLRSLAYKLNLSTIKKSEIRSANKAVLIEALLDKGVEH
ncbi:BMC domain-containing protein [Tissierella carlieri]|uniref:BMC domain-containing protein n=1 Tax=Tissierella carlieri TaxID=689904 RepID=A0ABT1S6H5_9FIRM|nr:BMC domain-containing protein [Tissierella carlieri]MCQ4922071.1 BMC domain-containing protein [Tissierella carlieri]